MPEVPKSYESQKVLHGTLKVVTMCPRWFCLQGARQAVRPGEEVPRPNRGEELPEARQQHDRGELDTTYYNLMGKNKSFLTPVNFLNRSSSTSVNPTFFMWTVLLIVPPLPPSPPLTCPLLNSVLLGFKR